MHAELILADIKDIPVLRELADEIWKQHYPPIIGWEQTEFMLHKMYSESSLMEQMQQGQLFYLIQTDGKANGFLSVSDQGEGHWFLNKYYLRPEIQGKGLGSFVFHRLLDELHPAEMRLTVNRQNYKSINFYFKNGFVIEKVADFDIGNGFFMNDFVMVRK